MKRSKEVTIIVNALVHADLIKHDKTDRARCVIKDAIKEIRCEQYKGRHRANLFATEKEGFVRILKRRSESKMTKQSTDALYIDYHLAQQKFLDGKSTFMTKVREIREEIKRGRYKPYAILEEGKIKVNKLVYCDYSTHRALLKDKNLRKTVPAFNGSEVALYTTEEKEIVLLRDI